MSRLDRLAHALVRLYPRAWRERYEHEFVALLDDVGGSWRFVGDIIRGALVERVRQVLRPSGTAAALWPATPLRDRRAFVFGLTCLGAGWLVGSALASVVPDTWSVLYLVPVVILQLLDRSTPRKSAEGMPVYVVNPRRPGRLWRVRAPGFLRALVRLVFWPFSTARRYLSGLPIRASRAVAVACMTGYGMMAAAAPDMTRLGGAALNSAWIWVVLIMGVWMGVVGTVYDDPADDPRVRR